MKIITTFSGGKDSQAALLWVLNNMTKSPITVFCDTNWEHPSTYAHIDKTMADLGLPLITLRSKKYAGMADLAAKRSRFPSSQRRFCTSELKTIPMIDFILDEVRDDFIVIQGIRAAESANRAKMEAQCDYFKYYREPYAFDKNGKPKTHTYRRKEVLAYMERFATDVLRPVFDWSGQQVIDYILDNGQEPNPLYRMGYRRVGCYPCVMCSHRDILNISMQDPGRIEHIADLESEIGSSFFAADKIPAHAYRGDRYSIRDVVNYVQWKNATGDLFDDNPGLSCMSFYGLCE